MYKGELDPIGVDNLRCAVVEQAVKDYRKALNVLRRQTSAVLSGRSVRVNYSWLYEIVQCERFFKEYCSLWISADGWAIRNEVLRQSGMREDVLKALLDNYKTTKAYKRSKEKEERNNDSET